MIATSAVATPEILRRDACDTQIAYLEREISGSARPSSDANDPHCCPSAFRESVLRWNGTSWEEISSEVTRTIPPERPLRSPSPGRPTTMRGQAPNSCGEGLT